MTGDIIIYHKKGWSCSNDGIIEVQKDIVRDLAGKAVATKSSNIAIANGAYHVVGELNVQDHVECAIKLNDGQKMSFGGHVLRITGKTVSIKINTKMENKSNEIITKIKKSWQE